MSFLSYSSWHPAFSFIHCAFEFRILWQDKKKSNISIQNKCNFWKFFKSQDEVGNFKNSITQLIGAMPSNKNPKKMFVFSPFTQKWTFWDVSSSQRKKKSSFINIFWLWRSNFRNFFLSFFCSLKLLRCVFVSNWTNFFRLLHFQLFSSVCMYVH